MPAAWLDKLTPKKEGERKNEKGTVRHVRPVSVSICTLSSSKMLSSRWHEICFNNAFTSTLEHCAPPLQLSDPIQVVFFSFSFFGGSLFFFLPWYWNFVFECRQHFGNNQKNIFFRSFLGADKNCSTASGLFNCVKRNLIWNSCCTCYISIFNFDFRARAFNFERQPAGSAVWRLCCGCPWNICILYFIFWLLKIKNKTKPSWAWRRCSPHNISRKIARHWHELYHLFDASHLCTPLIGAMLILSWVLIQTSRNDA